MSRGCHTPLIQWDTKGHFTSMVLLLKAHNPSLITRHVGQTQTWGHSAGYLARMPQDFRVMKNAAFFFLWLRKMEKLSQTRKGNGVPWTGSQNGERAWMEDGWDPNKAWSLISSHSLTSVSNFYRRAVEMQEGDNDIHGWEVSGNSVLLATLL